MIGYVAAGALQREVDEGWQALKNGLALKSLWGLVVVYAAMLFTSSIWPRSVPVALLVLFLLAFILIHGALRYHWTGILLFVAIALVVSNLLENVSILTGFPFGHYYYTDALGMKLFLVPALIGPAYLGTGYLAWVIGNALVGDVRRGAPAFTVVATPVIAAGAMVVWDLSFDPTLSTIDKFWIWTRGGGYFGVPLTNYLGWFLTVYLFYQLFALAICFGVLKGASAAAAQPAPLTYYLQAVVTYAVIGLSFVLQFLAGHDTVVVDATGAMWHTQAIHETSAIVAIYTMVFLAALTAIKLIQSAQALRATSAPVDSDATTAAERPTATAEPVV
jgi:putative membrane protein